MKRTATAACLACAASLASLAQAVTYNVPPDAIPATLAAGDILNYDPGIALFDLLPSPPAGATVNLLSGNAEFAIAAPISGALNLIGGDIATPFYADGATITIGAGSMVGDVSIINTRLQISGGKLNVELYATNSEVRLDGGEITILGGISQSTVTMTDGVIGLTLVGSLVDGTINVSGGTVGDINIATGTTLNMSGGQVGVGPGMSFFVADVGSTVHLTVQEAQLDGIPIGGLIPGSSVPIDVTGLVGELTGVLADGSPFLFDLGTADNSGTFPHDPVIVTTPPISMPTQRIEVLITLVPEPAALPLAGCALAATLAAAGVRSRRVPVES